MLDFRGAPTGADPTLFGLDARRRARVELGWAPWRAPRAPSRRAARARSPVLGRHRRVRSR
eukprot:7428829-Alexandrium_andersonii.AAC.1